MTPNASSMPFAVCLYFASNPDEELLSSDIAVKFGGPSKEVSNRLRKTRDAGWLSELRREPIPEKGGTRIVYGAGPALLAAIGRPA